MREEHHEERVRGKVQLGVLFGTKMCLTEITELEPFREWDVIDTSVAPSWKIA